MKPKELIKILESKGFYLKRSKGSHQIFRNDQTGKMTVVPVHNRDLPVGTFNEILKQAGINKDDLNKK